ncbi:MAG: YiiX/YebB-like N1pC/P60 family cysteine hydrolase [Verrucomicrobiota bacterium]
MSEDRFSGWQRYRLVVLVGVLVGLVVYAYGGALLAKVRYQPQEGDVLFQSLPNPPGLDLVDAIEGASGSPYSHCGVVVEKEGEWYVLEGMVPVVQETPLSKWIGRGRGKFTVYRLKSELRVRIGAWIAEMREEMGKAYDFRYRMEDDAIYCSELPFDGWKRLTGEEMGKVVELGELNWEPYRAVIAEIEGTDELPLQRKMITPKNLARSEQLEFVLANGLKRE